MSGDPRARLCALFCLGILVVCLEGAPALGLVALLPVSALLLHAGMNGWRLRFLGGAALLCWTTALSQGLFYAAWPRTPLLALGEVVLWREGMIHGCVQSLRFIALLAGGLLLAVSTPPDRLVAALLAFRVPYGLALMGVTALRFVPLVGTELMAVRRARARRGRPVWRRGPWAWLRLEADLLRPVVARSLRRAHALAESLETRGFHPTAPRAIRRPLERTRTDTAAVLTAAAATGIVVIARALYVLYGAEIYYAPSLRGVYAFVRAWL